LIITCNKEGKLAKEPQKNSVLTIILPPESNDQGLAMTGSFTGMLLAGLLISNIERIQSLWATLEILCQYAESLLTKFVPVLENTANLDFDRALFLGSGPLLGCAIESHMKLQEMTNGKVICKFDSYLGLRHGPKVIINSRTLVVAFLSNNSHVNRYEMDLLSDICRRPSAKTLIITESRKTEDYIHDQIVLSPDSVITLEEDFLPVCYVISAQLIGFFKSLNLKLKPDSPCDNNAITRVVSGVRVYLHDN
jgi:tagatose-6-phosphate ketose/aldose isomerase